MALTAATRIVHGTCHHDCPDSCGWTVDGRGRGRRQAPRPRRPPVQRRRAVPEGQPLPRSRVQPRPDPAPAAARRAEGRGRSSSRSRGTTRWPRSPTRLHAVIDARGPEAILPYSDAGNQSLLSMMGMDGRFFHALGASRVDPGDLRADRRPRRADDERQRPRPRPARAAPQQADPDLGLQHPPHQPPPLADDRGRARRRRQGRRDRSDPHAHRRGRRRVRAAAARAPTSP